MYMLMIVYIDIHMVERVKTKFFNHFWIGKCGKMRQKILM